MKTCNRCDITKKENHFRADVRYNGGYIHQCKLCEGALRKDRYERDREKELTYSRERFKNLDKQTRKKYKLKHRYNLSLEQYEQMLIEQNYECKICRDTKNLCVDHCHTTNKIRGLLCSTCNKALGAFKDNINILNSAIKYLDHKENL